MTPYSGLITLTVVRQLGADAHGGIDGAGGVTCIKNGEASHKL